MNDYELSTWIFSLLSDLDSLSDQTIESCAAILMNLGLRTRGMKECVKDATRTLAVLNELIENDNNQVKTYVNGLLYSLFSDEGMREKARMIGMEEQLIYLKEVSGDQLAKQIEFVIQRLNSGFLRNDYRRAR